MVVLIVNYKDFAATEAWNHGLYMYVGDHRNIWLISG